MVEGVDELAEIMHCKIGSLPMNYLGMPLGSSYKEVAVWNSIFMLFLGKMIILDHCQRSFGFVIGVCLIIIYVGLGMV